MRLDLHMAQLMPLPLTVSCLSKIQIGLTFLVLAHLGCPRQRTVKRVYVISGESALCRWMRAWCGCKILSFSFRSATVCLQKLRKPSRELGHSLQILRHQDRYVALHMEPRFVGIAQRDLPQMCGLKVFLDQHKD